MVCNTASGRCVECNTAVDCGGERVCLGNRCLTPVRCTTSRMCPGQVCSMRLGYCVDCDTDVDCAGQVCRGNVCVAPPRRCQSSRECSDLGLVCAPVRGQCVECVADTDCPMDRYCGAELTCAVRVCVPNTTACASPTRVSRCNALGSGRQEMDCPAGQVCRGGACQAASCTPGRVDCDPATAVRRRCDDDGGGYTPMPCAAGETCRDGACVPRTCTPGTAQCPAGTAARVVCNADGASTRTEPCPAAANATPRCGEGGACAVTCDVGFADCNAMAADGCETDLGGAANCGRCGNRCPGEMSCAGGVCVAEPTLRIDALGTTGCRTVEHRAYTGNRRMGFAVSSTHVFVTGTMVTAQAALGDLSGLGAIGVRHTAPVYDLATGNVYVLMDAMGQQIPDYFLPSMPRTITQLGLLDGATGALTATRVRLSSPITVANDYETAVAPTKTAIFAGRGRAYLFALEADNATLGTWYQILLPSGAVTRLRESAPHPPRRVCDGWASWGVAEYFGGEAYAVFPTAMNNTIVRYRIRDGMTTTLATITTNGGLADLCAFAVSPRLNRWYFHYQSAGFATTARTEQIVGYCDATVSMP